MKALIVGVTGQDGALLANLLISFGVEVHGTYRTQSGENFWRLEELGVLHNIVLHNYSIGNGEEFSQILQRLTPDLIYSFAGASGSSRSFENPKDFLLSNVGSTVEQLEAIRSYSANAKIFFACSSEVFGASNPSIPLNERADFHPSTPYGISKLAQCHLIRLYREKYGLQLFTGLLFPHESPFRSTEFVTRKITQGLVATHLLAAAPVILGDLSMFRDWGYAGDYVIWMHDLITRGPVGDYVFSTGINTTVEEYLLLSAQELDLDLEIQDDAIKGITQYVDKKSQKTYAISDSNNFPGNRFSYGPGQSDKLFSVIGVRKIVKVSELASIMVQADIKRI